MAQLWKGVQGEFEPAQQKEIVQEVYWGPEDQRNESNPFLRFKQTAHRAEVQAVRHALHDAKLWG